jgi:hypothetical protein
VDLDAQGEADMTQLATLDGLPQFMSAPATCQFARDGVWEEAWSFPSDRPPSLPELDGYFANRTEVAFEAFFGRAFFGVRLSGTAPEVKAFSIQCLKAANAQASFFDALRHALGCPVLGQKPDFAEIGCVNAWRSIGAFRITQPQPSASEFELLWNSMCDSPIGRDTDHAKAIEFAFKQPLEHWFGIPVSIEGGSNLVSKTLLHQTIVRVGIGLSRTTQKLVDPMDNFVPADGQD